MPFILRLCLKLGYCRKKSEKKNIFFYLSHCCFDVSKEETIEFIVHLVFPHQLINETEHLFEYADSEESENCWIFVDIWFINSGFSLRLAWLSLSVVFVSSYASFGYDSDRSALSCYIVVYALFFHRVQSGSSWLMVVCFVNDQVKVASKKGGIPAKPPVKESSSEDSSSDDVSDLHIFTGYVLIHLHILSLCNVYVFHYYYCRLIPNHVLFCFRSLLSKL